MEPERRLAGRYRLIGRLDGGPGEVWRAWDERLGRQVAVRLPGDGTDLHERVVRAVKVAHPAFVTVYDSHEEDGVPFVVTALPDGESLAGRLADGLPLAEALDCCAQVAEALSAAHEEGLAHGTLTPEKIFLTPDGARIVDLGIATEANPEDDVTALGALLAECPEPPEEIVQLAAQCSSPNPEARPTMPNATKTLHKTTTPTNTPNPVEPADKPEPLDATLIHPSPTENPQNADPQGGGPWDSNPRGPSPQGADSQEVGVWGGVTVFRVAVGVSVVAASLATVLVVANRGVFSGQGGVLPPVASATARPAPSPVTSSPVPVPAVYETLGRLQPIVDGGRASGQIRSDVAVDLNNSITNLRNDLASGDTADAAESLRLLREKIATRLRERALDAGVAAQMDDVLAATAP